MSEIKPAAFKNGVPKAERNGFFGAEADFIESAGERIIAVVTYEVVRVMHEEIEDEKYPVIEVQHIEPLRDEKAIAAALKLRDAAYKARTGENVLDIAEVEE
jgi:Lon protease-like protein